MVKGKVSVIVPVHNCGKYLDECLNSIICQSYDNIEILLIDDHSIDDSAKIYDKYCQIDSRIQVYRTDESGVSASRNLGLQNADGEYIQFVDGDDAIQRNMIERMVVSIQNTSSDMVVCNYKRRMSSIFSFRNRFVETDGIYENWKYMEMTLRDPGHHYYGVVWNKLFLKQWIDKYGLQFQQDVSLGEDFIFTMQYISCVNRFSILADALYVYNRQEANTLSRSVHPNYEICVKELVNREKIYLCYCDCFKAWGKFDEYQSGIEKYWIEFYVRQKAILQTYGESWNDKQRMDFENMIDEHPYIQSALTYFEEEEIHTMIMKYLRKTKQKEIIKKVLGIL